MSRNFLTHLLLCCLLLGACKKKQQDAQPLAIDRVPMVVEKAFESAPPEVNSVAREVAVSVRMQDPKALGTLQELTTRPGLTSEQQLAATRAMLSVHKQLLDAAGKGDKKAEEALARYRATK